VPKAPPPTVQHFIYPVSDKSGYYFRSGELVSKATFQAEVRRTERSDWGLANGYKLVQPGDWIWVYVAGSVGEISGIGHLVSPPAWDEETNRYRIIIEWNRRLTNALTRSPIPYSAYQQHVQGPVVRANPKTLRVLQKWIRREGPAEFKRSLEFKLATIPVNARLGQPNFRMKLLEAYGGRCAISGCRESSVLEAAHILPIADKGGHLVENGILLRSDLHNLFDQGRITIKRDGTVSVAKDVRDRSYRRYDGRPLEIPRGVRRGEFRGALAAHRRLHSGSG
jgi:hypothetical protein